MSREQRALREYYLNKFLDDYKKNQYRGEGGNLITDDANRNLLDNINSYIGRFIEGDETLSNTQKYYRYKQLNKKVKSTIKKLSKTFLQNSVNADDLYELLYTNTMPLIEQIDNKINEFRPPPVAIPVADVIPETPRGTSLVDRFRSMIGLSEPTQEIIATAEVNPTAQVIPTSIAIPFVGEQQDFITMPVAQPIEERPSNRSPRAGLNIITRPAEPVGGGAAPEPRGGGAAPEDIETSNNSSIRFV